LDRVSGWGQASSRKQVPPSWWPISSLLAVAGDTLTRPELIKSYLSFSDACDPMHPDLIKRGRFRQGAGEGFVTGG